MNKMISAVVKASHYKDNQTYWVTSLPKNGKVWVGTYNEDDDTYRFFMANIGRFYHFKVEPMQPHYHPEVCLYVEDAQNIRTVLEQYVRDSNTSLLLQ